jgi:predicted  nucleic acid-binding Zn-ribbon protein
MPAWFPAICFVFSVFFILILPAGCRQREREQTQQELREARATINKLNYSLRATEERIATKEAELRAVQQSRDELQKQMDQMVRERDQAADLAQQAREAITRLTKQESSQSSETAALRTQVAELKTLVEDQQKLIEQLQSGTAVEATPAVPQGQAPPTEPNESP